MAKSDAERQRLYRQRLRKRGHVGIMVHLPAEAHAVMIDHLNQGYEPSLRDYIEHAITRHAAVLERMAARKRSRSK